MYLDNEGGTLEMGVSNAITLTRAFYYANHNDYSGLGEKASYSASNTVPAIPGAVPQGSTHRTGRRRHLSPVRPDRVQAP